MEENQPTARSALSKIFKGSFQPLKEAFKIIKLGLMGFVEIWDDIPLYIMAGMVLFASSCMIVDHNGWADIPLWLSFFPVLACVLAPFLVTMIGILSLLVVFLVLCVLTAIVVATFVVTSLIDIVLFLIKWPFKKMSRKNKPVASE